MANGNLYVRHEEKINNQHIHIENMKALSSHTEANTIEKRKSNDKLISHHCTIGRERNHTYNQQKSKTEYSTKQYPSEKITLKHNITNTDKYFSHKLRTDECQRFTRQKPLKR